MNFEQSFQLSNLRQQELRQAAENARWLRESVPQHNTSNAVLAALGRQLVSLGQKLQNLAQVEPSMANGLQPETR
jgi:hypothetical protein